jgi:hypothetical protein
MNQTMKRQFWFSGLSLALVCLVTTHSLHAQRGSKIPLDTYRFAPGVRLLTGDKPIDVTTGHAAPYVYDFNGDGKRDLLVGEFGSGTYRGETTSKSSLANARLRVYLNKGSNASPRYDGFKYLQADGENASVPST